MIGDCGPSDRYKLNSDVVRVFKDDIKLKFISTHSTFQSIFANSVGDPFLIRDYLSNARRELTELIEWGPDIAFTDDPYLSSSYAKLYSLLRSSRMPLILWLHGDIWSENYARFRNKGFQNMLRFVEAQAIHTMGMQRANRILANCRWLERIVARRFPQKRTGVLYRGIELEPWLLQDDSRYDFQRPAVGIIQPNSIYPKVMGLLKFSRVVRQMPDVNFYIAGGGEYAPLVKREYSDLPNAHLMGKLSYPDEVRRFLRSVGIYLLASGLDTGPKTLLQASLCERPVLASRVAGVPELVLEGQTGWTIPNHDTHMWIRKIRELVEDGSLCKKIGMNGRRFVTKNFGLDTFVSRLKSILMDELRT